METEHPKNHLNIVDHKVNPILKPFFAFQPINYFYPMQFISFQIENQSSLNNMFTVPLSL